MLKAAVLGCGVISHIHIPVIQAMPDVELVAVCDIDGSKDPKLPGVQFYTDYRELYEKERPDVVHVCLPHYLHYPVSRFFADRGVHVFCEKPAALNTSELEKFIQLEEEHPELKIGISFQNRYNPTTETMKEIIAGGEYGRVLSIYVSNPWSRDQAYYDQGPWRGEFALSGGGVMINQAIHALDLMCLFCGTPVSVKGSVSCLLSLATDVEDTAAARIEFESGVHGLFFASNANGFNMGPVICVTMEKKTFVIDSRRLYGIGEDQERTLIVKDDVLAGEKFYYGSSHGKLIGKFYGSIVSGGSDYVHVRDAYFSNRLIDAIVRSSATGQTIAL